MLPALRVRVGTVAFASSLLAVVATPGCKDPVTPPELIVAATDRPAPSTAPAQLQSQSPLSAGLSPERWPEWCRLTRA